MAEILRHHPEDLLEHAYISDPNLMIGRIGLPGQNPHPWPISSDGSESGLRVFVSGPLLDRADNESMRQLPDNATLRDWRGFFSGVLTEPVHRTALLVTDRRASHPIYYHQTKGQLFFAPEVKALLPSLQPEKEIDLEALATYLAQGYLLGDQTFFKAVRRLQGGELLRVQDGTVSKESYWRFVPGLDAEGASEDELAAELCQLLDAAARKHLGDPERTIIFLSGGVDSRGILGGALTQVQGRGERLSTVTWGASQGTKDSDVAVAAAIAHSLHTNHRFLQRQVNDYREHFARVNYQIDGLSEIAAFHPYEYQLMVDIRNSGFKRVLRGDEVFGWTFPASSHEGAFALANLRRLRDVQGLASVIQESAYDQLCKASDTAVERAIFEAHDLSPNQAKDFFYFTHRLQCYLQTASYSKQIELDQRNVLLDDPILDFLAKVPDSMRIDKILYRKVVARHYPFLAQFPYAKQTNFENWIRLLTTASPVRAYVLEELDDRSSGIWQFLNPFALTGVLAELGKKLGIRSRLGQLANPKVLVKRGLEIFAPDLLSQIRSERRARLVVHLGAEKIIMRSLVLKNWYDTFV